MIEYFTSKILLKILGTVIVCLLAVGCQTYQYPKSAIEVKQLTLYSYSDKIFSSPAYPVGNPKDRVNVSFYAKVLDDGDVDYTMWIAFPKKLDLRLILSEGDELSWKLIQSDNKINLIKVSDISITSNFVLNFEDAVRKIIIPEWWIDGFYSKFKEKVAEKKRIKKLREESRKIAEESEVLRREYVKKRRISNENIAKLIEKKSIGIGMTKNDVVYSWGEPDKINRSVYSSGVHEQWIYRGNKYLYFKNGILSSWQESH